jgi:tRNA (guanine-N7-)-methyltransferase
MARRIRIRQHVNPLSLHYADVRARPVAIPAPLLSRAGPQPRTEVELGCADAQFSVRLAARHPDRLVIALDIRERIVDFARTRAEAAGLDNLVAAYCNLAVDLEHVLAPRSVDRFHLLFPDPWFKPKHRKRRVIETDVLAVLRSRLRDGGELHVASDVFEIAMAVMAEIDGERDDEFANLAGPWRFWRDNPFGARSKREDMTLRRGQRVWRLRYQLR